MKIIPNGSRVDILDEVFSDKAKIWFDSQSFTDYNDFKRKFIEEFYSIPIRVRIKGEWLARRFDPSKDQLSGYFLSQIKDAQYFSPPLESYELHYTIIQQLPLRVREILSTIDFADFQKISHTLSQLQNTHKEKQGNSHKSVPQHINQFDKKTSENKSSDFKVRESRFTQGRGPQNHGSRENNSSNVISSNIDAVPYTEGNFQFSKSNIPHARYNISLPDLSIPPPKYSWRQGQSNSISRCDLNS